MSIVAAKKKSKKSEKMRKNEKKKIVTRGESNPRPLDKKRGTLPAKLEIFHILS